MQTPYFADTVEQNSSKHDLRVPPGLIVFLLIAVTFYFLL